MPSLCTYASLPQLSTIPEKAKQDTVLETLGDDRTREPCVCPVRFWGVLDIVCLLVGVAGQS